MGAPVNACVPVVYVADVVASVAFYEHLGFAVQAEGQEGEWCYAYLKCGEVGVLLAAGGPAWSTDPGPVHLYLRTDDVAGIETALRTAGIATEHLGHPDHAPGGEVKVVDPDGHVLLIGQISGAAPPDRTPSPEERSSILARAAAAARARGAGEHRCQFPLSAGHSCGQPADIKMADACGDSAWTCLTHAEEIMINAKGVFIAAEDAEGLANYLRRRQGTLR